MIYDYQPDRKHTHPEKTGTLSFGYDENDSLGEYYSDDIYLVSTNKDKIIYEEVVPDVAHLRFIDNDFIQLDNDNTVLKLYENEYLRSYYIY